MAGRDRDLEQAVVDLEDVLTQQEQRDKRIDDLEAQIVTGKKMLTDLREENRCLLLSSSAGSPKGSKTGDGNADHKADLLESSTASLTQQEEENASLQLKVGDMQGEIDQLNQENELLLEQIQEQIREKDMLESKQSSSSSSSSSSQLGGSTGSNGDVSFSGAESMAGVFNLEREKAEAEKNQVLDAERQKMLGASSKAAAARVAQQGKELRQTRNELREVREDLRVTKRDLERELEEVRNESVRQENLVRKHESDLQREKVCRADDEQRFRELKERMKAELQNLKQALVKEQSQKNDLKQDLLQRGEAASKKMGEEDGKFKEFVRSSIFCSTTPRRWQNDQ